MIKVDVEGQEWAVLQGAEGLLIDGRVKAIYFDGYNDKILVEGVVTRIRVSFPRNENAGACGDV